MKSIQFAENELLRCEEKKLSPPVKGKENNSANAIRQKKGGMI